MPHERGVLSVLTSKRARESSSIVRWRISMRHAFVLSSLLLFACHGHARVATTTPPPTTTVETREAPPPPPPGAETAVMPAEKNHGQERKEEVHERNEARKEAHDEMKAEKKEEKAEM